MTTGEVVGYTVGLVVVAGITAGFWLNLLMWIPMLIIGGLIDDESVAFPIVSFLAMLVAAATVVVVGVSLDLPWYAAAIAGLLVGMTSYARPNPAASY